MHAKMKREALRVGGPWYGVASSGGEQRQISGYGTGGDHASLALLHRWSNDRWVQVETGTDPHDPWDDTAVLDEWIIHYSSEADLRSKGFPLRIEVDRWEAPMNVCAEEIPFVFIGTDRNWHARGMRAGRRIIVKAEGFATAELKLVEVDPKSSYEEPR
jgi:hypothetical protein